MNEETKQPRLIETVETEIREIKLLGLTFPVRVPKTIEGFDILAKQPGAVLRNAIQQILYHVTANDIRSVLTDEVEKFLKEKEGLEVSWVKSKNGDEETHYNPADWLNLAIAKWAEKTGTAKTVKDLEFMVPIVVANPKCDFDPAVSERKPPQPKKIPADMLLGAKQLLSKNGTTRKDGKVIDVAQITARLAELNKDEKIVAATDEATGLPTEEYLARLLHANELRMAREARAARAANLVEASF